MAEGDRVQDPRALCSQVVTTPEAMSGFFDERIVARKLVQLFCD